MVEPLIASEWNRAQECLGAANLCKQNGFYADAVARAYYAMLHAARAAIRFRGVLTSSRRSTHRAVLRLFGEYLVRPGLIEPEWSDDLRQGHEERIRADYGVFETFEEPEATDACERARAFLSRISLLLDSSASPGDSPAGA